MAVRRVGCSESEILMVRHNNETLSRWLAAEGAGNDSAAEQALAQAFAALPLPLPPVGFAEQVMARVGLREIPATYSRWSQAAIAATLFWVGSALAYILPLAFGVSRLISPGDVVATLVSGVVGVSNQLDVLFGVWRFFANLADSLFLIAMSPPVTLTVVGLATLSALTVRGLSELLSSNRNSAYVQAL